MNIRNTICCVAALCCAAALGAAPAAHAQSGSCGAWMDASKPAEQRAQALLKAMTLDDKIRLTYGSASPQGFASQIPANDRLCIPAFVQTDGPAGIAGGFGGTQQGVTPFPAGMAQAASWNTDLQRKLGRAMAREALGKGANVLLAPATNINRVPTNGRNFEYFGEDPLLAARTTVAEIEGIQSEPVVATVKHYALNNQETERMTISVEADERTKREIYYPAFEAAVRAGVGSVMCSYNRIGGTYACENDTLLNKVLKGDWGFDGYVMSDWFATHSTEKAALAGLDQEHNGFGANFFGDKLKQAIQQGRVPQQRIDDLVLRVLRPAFRLGLFDKRAAAQPGAYAANVSTPEHQQIAKQVAEEGSVLLKNDGILPLDKLKAGQRIAVVGTYAAAGATTASVAGTGSAHVLGQAVDPLSEITKRAQAKGATVAYADGTLHQDAAAVARGADVAIVFVRDAVGEGNDRPTEGLNDSICAAFTCQRLPSDQDGMVTAVADVNPNTVVVLLTGGPVTMPWAGKVKGLLEMWYPGSQYGTAAASLLFGEANPSGKLPQTFPVKAADLPVKTPEQYPGKDGKVHYTEGLQVGYRWHDAQNIAPQFPFGHGLSYTTFSVGGLKVEAAPSGVGATVAVDVKNTGGRAGAEVPQVYLGFPSATGEPPKQLKGYQKVQLAPGEQRTVRIGLDDRAFSTWGADGWQVAPGCYRVMAGRSSRDITDQVSVQLGDAPCPNAVARIALPSKAARSCASRRTLTIRPRKLRRRERVRTLTVSVNGRQVSALRGAKARTALRRGVRMDFRGRRPGKVTVRIVARTTRGRTVRTTRTYRLCVKTVRR